MLTLAVFLCSQKINSTPCLIVALRRENIATEFGLILKRYGGKTNLINVDFVYLFFLNSALLQQDLQGKARPGASREKHCLPRK